ncbi:MAG TPA: type ISP restriction/modification enzyme [Chloroflexia bacterium]|nr:type ISP restriction/modification enzyme [Chloroflexia bacterium]
MPPKLPPAVAAYYQTLATIEGHGAANEGATRAAFQTLLSAWAAPQGLTLLAEQTMDGTRQRPIRLDGVLVDDLHFRRGCWEAKDSVDDLDAAIPRKIAAGYPLANTLFENTRRAVLFQDGRRALDADLRDPAALRALLDTFVTYAPAQIAEFHRAVARFRDDLPQLAAGLTALIDDARRTNPAFRAALDSFLALCRSSLNPATTPAEVEDMLKQHLLTERIFRTIFANPDFVRRNAVAAELEKMVDALTGQSFSRAAFLHKLDYFYAAIEATARTIDSYPEKQDLLRTLYEQFFQAYSTRAADTHGIVYTPPAIVGWMVASVEQALAREFGLGLAAPGVHIVDPCTGTGTFVMEILHRLPAAALEAKYTAELHANEVLLLPYYIAAQNIEHAYVERLGRYAPFAGLCFADTLDLADSPQLDMFAPANSQRVEQQKAAPIRVVLGNPPYNVGQISENDNNKNRKHPTVDKRVAATYAKSSHASNKNALSDIYVKFFRWATDRLGDRDGVVCFVSNNSFLDQIAFDGMRQHLLQDFTRLYVFDLGGNVRKNPKLSGSKHNVFGIQVGVAITLLVRNRQHPTPELFYTRVDEFWTREQKLEHLAATADYTQVNWQPLIPDARGTWLTAGLQADFDTFLPIASKDAKAGAELSAEAIFKTYSRGVATTRDNWVYDFNREELERKIKLFIDTYDSAVDRWERLGQETRPIDEFVHYDDKAIKWSESLKANLMRGKHAHFDESRIRQALYRPFCKQFLYFDRILNERVYLFPSIFPTPETEQENSIIWLKVGTEWPMFALMANKIVDLLPQGGSQCFPFYTYAADGSGRRENITDWALAQFQAHYGDPGIGKGDLFHYVYAVLHSPAYRARYAANLKRDLPRIPFVPAAAWSAYVAAGARLATLHRDYAAQPPYPLRRVETPGEPFHWAPDPRGLRLTPDRTALRVNAALTLAGIPPAVFAYQLGHRSALEWVVDQYRVAVDPRSGLRHDPTDPADPAAIVRLVEQVVQVSLATVALVAGLPPLE